MKFPFFFLIFCCVLTGSASIIKKPPVKPIDMTYAELVCTDQDKANIREIITTMGQNGKLQLLFNQSHLKEIGAQIQHVHPLKFLSTIFSQPDLKIHMISIWDDYFKRKHLLEGLSNSLTNESVKGKLNQYIGEFAEEINVRPENIQSFFDAQDWEGLVYHLIYP